MPGKKLNELIQRWRGRATSLLDANIRMGDGNPALRLEIDASRMAYRQCADELTALLKKGDDTDGN